MNAERLADNCFVDANVFMYAVGAPHRYKNACADIVEGIADGRVQAVTNVEIIQEILYRYTRLDERARAMTLAQWILQIMTSILPVTRADVAAAIEIMQAIPQVLPRDAIHAATAMNAGIKQIISADHDLDRIPGIVRVDPLEVS